MTIDVSAEEWFCCDSFWLIVTTVNQNPSMFSLLPSGCCALNSEG